MIVLFNNLLNSNSKAMNVNGSVTPQSFIYSPSNTVAISGLSCVFKDEGTTSLNKFGILTALSNGIVIQTIINGITTTITTIKDNSDMCTRFYSNQFGNSAVLSILGIGTAQGFGASNNIFVGFMDLSTPYFITINSGDTIQAVVQDDLRNIDLLEIAVKFCIDG